MILKLCSSWFLTLLREGFFTFFINYKEFIFYFARKTIITNKKKNNQLKIEIII